jgi:hypothetical protein
MTKTTTTGTPRELLRVYVQQDGALDIRILATWADDPMNEKPTRLSKAVAAAIVGVLGGESEVPAFFRLNRPQ